MRQHLQKKKIFERKLFRGFRFLKVSHQDQVSVFTKSFKIIVLDDFQRFLTILKFDFKPCIFIQYYYFINIMNTPKGKSTYQ